MGLKGGAGTAEEWDTAERVVPGRLEKRKCEGRSRGKRGGFVIYCGGNRLIRFMIRLEIMECLIIRDKNYRRGVRWYAGVYSASYGWGDVFELSTGWGSAVEE